VTDNKKLEKKEEAAQQAVTEKKDIRR